MRAGSAPPRVSLWGRRFRSRRDHSFIASQKTVLYFMPRLLTPSPMGGQGVSSCAITSSADENCAVKEKKKRSRSTRLIIYWLWMISAVSARFVFATKTACFSARRKKGAGPLRHSSNSGHLLSASRAVEANKETAADLAYLRGRGTSLGGMRPKCTVIDEDGSLSIGKFPSIADERAVTKGEVLALTLARKAGIDAASARIVQCEELPVALIRRFDRQNNGHRLMYVSAATMLGVEATEPEEHTYTEIVDAIRVHGADAQADIEELWRRIAFSILITNSDDHLRNHGFLHVDREFWRLSPAFDINPSPERVRELKTWISEDAGPDMTIDALMSVIAYFRITAARAKEILSDVTHAVNNWRKTGRSIGMSDEELEPFADAFEHGERAAAKRLI